MYARPEWGEAGGLDFHDSSLVTAEVSGCSQTMPSFVLRKIRPRGSSTAMPLKQHVSFLSSKRRLDSSSQVTLPLALAGTASWAEAIPASALQPIIAASEIVVVI
jgi:hypothetical protein